MNAPLSLTVNGEPLVTSALTVAALIESLGLPPQAALVEHNGRALLRSEWCETQMAAGDRLEILRVSAGG
jgi:sulfur carrier protein